MTHDCQYCSTFIFVIFANVIYCSIVFTGSSKEKISIPTTTTSFPSPYFMKACEGFTMAKQCQENNSDSNRRVHGLILQQLAILAVAEVPMGSPTSRKMLTGSFVTSGVEALDSMAVLATVLYGPCWM